MEYTVGELAKRSGLTVRALHHYEKMGLLPPSGRTQAGYRLYAERDVRVLHRILAYRQMGVVLKEIGPLLCADAPPLRDVLTRQLAAAKAELARQQALVATLERVAQRAQKGNDQGDLTDELLGLMRLMRTYERYFSENELQQLREMQARLGDEGLQHIKAEVAVLLPAMRDAMEAGTDPHGPAVAVLARRWLALDRLFPVDDSLRDKGRAMLAEEPGLQSETGITPALIAFIDQAVLAAKKNA